MCQVAENQTYRDIEITEEMNFELFGNGNSFNTSVYMIGLVDCNNFYASCERVFNPNLNKKPVIVLSNNDGCVITRSNESKDLGIKMGEPVFKIKEIIKNNNVHVFQVIFLCMETYLIVL